MRRGIILTTLLVLLVLSVVAPVYAETGNATNDEDLRGVLANFIVNYLLAAIIWALAGYFKQQKKPDGTYEPFNPQRFFITLCVGIFVGIVAFVGYYTRGITWTFQEWYDYFVAAGIIAIVESILKIIWRRIAPWFQQVQQAQTTAPK